MARFECFPALSARARALPCRQPAPGPNGSSRTIRRRALNHTPENGRWSAGLHDAESDRWPKARPERSFNVFFDRLLVGAWRRYRVATYDKTAKPGDPTTTIFAGSNRPTRQRTTAHHSATAGDLLKVNVGQGFTFRCLAPAAAAMRLCAATSWSSVVATSHRRACCSIWRL